MSSATDPLTTPPPHPAASHHVSTPLARFFHSLLKTLIHPSSDRDATNVKIMIAAIIVLIVAILFILGLHLYAKIFWKKPLPYAPQQFRAYQLELSLDHDQQTLPESIEAMGGQAAAFNRVKLEFFPAFIYSRGLMEVEGMVDCAVCLCEFEDKESGRLLPNCNHIFHTECIDMWFRSHSTCPLCRLSILPLSKQQPVLESCVNIGINGNGQLGSVSSCRI